MQRRLHEVNPQGHLGGTDDDLQTALSSMLLDGTIRFKVLNPFAESSQATLSGLPETE